jgi:hypothetical protein
MDQEKAIFDLDENDDENFELAYAITIHKSQGSDFKNTFVVLPQKTTLLSKELLYTALTRSENRLNLFLQSSEHGNPLEIAREKSDVLLRNTSIFKEPEDDAGRFEPEKGIYVKSKIEYIIYSALKANGLEFQYEKELKLKGKKYLIHPDFTINLNGKTYYWEHLGELDVKDYYENWLKRKDNLIENGYYDHLITTDDLNGVSKSVIDSIIDDLLKDTLKTSQDRRFSKHHYSLKS